LWPELAQKEIDVTASAQIEAFDLSDDIEFVSLG
jgi:hypothetical protein